MTQDYKHPITPPPELVQQWVDMLSSRSDQVVFNLAAQWGADQELEVCCEVLDNLNEGSWSKYIRVARRPKPPSLKEQALKALKVLPTPDGQVTLDITDLNTIRRALEQLPNHE
jgi:hypothetical protein